MAFQILIHVGIYFMRQIVLITLSLMIFLAWDSKSQYSKSQYPKAQKPFLAKKEDKEEQIKELRVRKAELRAEFYKARYEQISSVYSKHDKHVLEAELNYKLHLIDLEIERLYDCNGHFLIGPEKQNK